MENISDLKLVEFSTKNMGKYACFIDFPTLSTLINMENLWINPLCTTKNVEKWSEVEIYTPFSTCVNF